MGVDVKGRGEYPRHWRLLATLVKCRAGWCCEHCGRPHEPVAGYTLTVHHLDGEPSNCDSTNLVALCQRCHLSWQSRFKVGQVMMDWARPAWMDARGLGR